MDCTRPSSERFAPARILLTGTCVVDADPTEPTLDVGMCIEVLSYLGQRPRARDTFEGVARWWLERFRAEREIRRLRLAVDFLSDRGFLEVDHRSDGNDHLGLPGGADVTEMIETIRTEVADG